MFAISVECRAKQHVVLHSGVELIGNVSMNGDSVTVDVDGATLVVMFREIASIRPSHETEQVAPLLPRNTSAGIGHSGRQATVATSSSETLLIRAIESWLLSEKNGTPNGDTSLFLNAYYSDLNNPATAYWYARALVDNGKGTAASKIFAAHREAIASDYPRHVDRLSERIRQRTRIEELPPKLVDRFDGMIAAGNHGTRPRNDYVPCYAIFRIRDQHGKPLPLQSSNLYISCDGTNKNLADFDDGYFLLTYERHRNSRGTSDKIKLSANGVPSTDLKLVGQWLDRAPNIVEYELQRLPNSSKRSVTVFVTDTEGKPIHGASVGLLPEIPAGTSREFLMFTTDRRGRVSVKSFPGEYTVIVRAKSFLDLRHAVEISKHSDTKPLRLSLLRSG